MEEIKLGSVVELQSESANNLMTVVDISDDRIRRITVRYEGKNDYKIKEEVYPAAALKVHVPSSVRSKEEDYYDV
jgi:hypothetical protein